MIPRRWRLTYSCNYINRCDDPRMNVIIMPSSFMACSAIALDSPGLCTVARTSRENGFAETSYRLCYCDYVMANVFETSVVRVGFVR